MDHNYLQKIATNVNLMIECKGTGSDNAEIAIILESPMEADIKLGMPLSGGSGGSGNLVLNNRIAIGNNTQISISMYAGGSSTSGVNGQGYVTLVVSR